MRALAPIALAVAMMEVAGCGASGHFNDQVYRDGTVAYRVGTLPPAWRRVRVGAAQLAFHHPSGGTISAHASCDRGDQDVPLDVLLNHRLIGIEERSERARTRPILDGRGAVRARIDGSLDGAEVALDLVVSRRDGCVYDLSLIAARPTFDERRPDFEDFLGGFSPAESP